VAVRHQWFGSSWLALFVLSGYKRGASAMPRLVPSVVDTAAGGVWLITWLSARRRGGKFRRGLFVQIAQHPQRSSPAQRRSRPPGARLRHAALCSVLTLGLRSRRR
jgi:hypothetical protein